MIFSPSYRHNKIISFDASNDNIFSTLNIEPALRTVLNSKVPVWLSLTNSKVDSTTSDSICSMNCIQRGLSWAQTLGDASKKGFKMVYMPIEKNEWFKPSLTYYTTLLHKRIMGEKVFETKMMSGNRVETHMYAHCTKNMSGSFTIFGVNPADSKTHVAAKVPFKSGTEFSEYILTVNSATGKVQLNGNDIIEGSNLGPATRNKRPNKSAMLSMPPYSVGFWVFTMADLSECEQIQSAQETQSKNRILTSSEQLLQELILETVGRKDKIEKNAIKPNTVLTLNRSRRFINNNILRTKSRNSINKESNNELHKRHRRNIADSVRPRRSGHLINRIYNDIDDIKRRQILAPYGKYGSVLQKRSKRQVNSLSRLFEKFDFRKPGIGFKSPPFKLGPSAIPPIATVHDIYAANSAEKQIFRSIENHDIPTGDIHFEVGDEKSFDYVSVDDDGRRTEQRFVNSDAIHEVPDDVNLHRIPNQFFESFYGDSRLPQLMPQPNYNENPPVQHGELWEADAIDLSPPPSISAPVPVPMVINQAEQQLQLIPNANQQNIEFVVKELQPTWHKNRENLQKARNNLHKYYAPTIGNKNRHVKISSMLPNVAHSQKAANPLFADSEERIFFETRRRRKRAIDAKMNDEIEKKIQHNTAQSNLHADVFDEYLEDTVDKINLLDRILKIVGSIENNQDVKSNNNFNKFSNDIKKLEDFIYQNQKEPKRQTRPKMPSNEIQKKCKVLSMSLEQQCLQNEPMQNRAIFKRNIKIGIEEKSKKPSGIVKKILTQTKLGTDKRSMRQRRSVSPFEVDEIHLNEILNEIPKEFNEVAVVQHFLKSPVAKADKESVSKVAEMSPKAMKNNQEYVPKFLEVMKSSVDRVLDIVTRHVSGWWQSIS